MSNVIKKNIKKRNLKSTFRKKNKNLRKSSIKNLIIKSHRKKKKGGKMPTIREDTTYLNFNPNKIEEDSFTPYIKQDKQAIDNTNINDVEAENADVENADVEKPKSMFSRFKLGTKNFFKRKSSGSDSDSNSMNQNSDINNNLDIVTDAIKDNTREIHQATDAIKNSSPSNPLDALLNNNSEEEEPKVIKETCQEPQDEQTITIRLPKGANMIKEGGPSIESKLAIMTGNNILSSPKKGGDNSKKQRIFKLRKRSRKRQKQLEKIGVKRESNPQSPAPKAGIIPLDH